jgi:hypothetical protein
MQALQTRRNAVLAGRLIQGLLSARLVGLAGKGITSLTLALILLSAETGILISDFDA